MLEVVFSKGKVGAEAVRILICGEKAKPYMEELSKDEQAQVLKALKQDRFEGKNGQVVEILGGKSKIIVAGMGKNPTVLDWQNLGGSLIKYLHKDAVACVVMPEDAPVCHLAFGVLLGSYSFDKYFTKKKAEEYSALEQIIFKVAAPEIAKEEFKQFAALANAVRYDKDLGNEPANYLTPEVFADDIERLKYLGLDIEIFDKQQLEEKGFGLLLAVAQGSVKEPKVAVVKWKGKPEQEEFDLGLVGKGVTFDSGGLSLKSVRSMFDDKGDMAGAAVVVASLKALALQAAKVNVVGIVGLVENMPSGNALRPGDVLTSLSGRTVEVLNTDAEGRLVLADCLSYIQNEFRVNNIIDIATLGSLRMVLGNVYGGMFANNEKLAKALLNAGEKSGEKLWQMPLDEQYKKMLKSNVADIANIAVSGKATIVSAAFLAEFVEKGVKWAHIDISGMRLDNAGMASGFGVKLVNELVKGLV